MNKENEWSDLESMLGYRSIETNFFPTEELEKEMRNKSRSIPRKKLPVCVDPSTLDFIISPGKGKGLKTKVPISKGSFVMEYVGVIGKTKDHQGDSMYLMALKGGFCVDAAKQGNLARFINHHCSPNMDVKIFATKGGLQRAFLKANRRIDAHEELTFDYNFEGSENSDNIICLCQSNKCRTLLSRPRQKCIKKVSFSCFECSKTFTRKAILDEHLKVHKQEKPHQCIFCPQAFTSPGNLGRHYLAHIKEKSFECVFCEKCFALKHQLKTHLKKKH